MFAQKSEGLRSWRRETTLASLPSPGDAGEARNRPGLLAYGGGWARGAAARCVACARGPAGSHWALDPLDPSAGSGPRAPRIQSMWRLTSVRLVRDTSVDHSGRLAGRVGCPCGCAARGIQALLFSAPSPCWPLPFTSLPWQHRADHLHRPSPTRC